MSKLYDMHPFEKAGLGAQPYRLVAVTKNVYVACPGAPAQPGSCCDFCGTGIMYEFWCISSDGKRFKVGCDCIHRSGDVKLSSASKIQERKLANEMRHEKERTNIATLTAWLALPETQTLLASIPHPQSWAAAKGQTLLDSVNWMMRNAGNSGKMRLLKSLRQYMETK
jgi:hypothetical protein